MPGGMTIQDAATALDTEWDTEAATVGGMVIEALGHIPTPGERISIGEYDFEIEHLADRAVESVIAVKLPTPRDEIE
jgi:magnesium and cobalt transporter